MTHKQCAKEVFKSLTQGKRMIRCSDDMRRGVDNGIQDFNHLIHPWNTTKYPAVRVKEMKKWKKTVVAS